MNQKSFYSLSLFYILLTCSLTRPEPEEELSKDSQEILQSQLHKAIIDHYLQKKIMTDSRERINMNLAKQHDPSTFIDALYHERYAKTQPNPEKYLSFYKNIHQRDIGDFIGEKGKENFRILLNTINHKPENNHSPDLITLPGSHQELFTQLRLLPKDQYDKIVDFVYDQLPNIEKLGNPIEIKGKKTIFTDFIKLVQKYIRDLTIPADKTTPEEIQNFIDTKLTLMLKNNVDIASVPHLHDFIIKHLSEGIKYKISHPESSSTPKFFDNSTHLQKEKDLALKILGLDRTATKEKIKEQYKKLALIHHPDKGGDQEQFKLLQNAYEKLTQ